MTPERAVTKLLAEGILSDHRVEVKLLFEAVRVTAEAAEKRRCVAIVRAFANLNPRVYATVHALADDMLRTGGLKAEE